MVAVASATARSVAVHRDPAAESGFAMIVEQFLTQSLEESEAKRRRAERLRGRISMTASDRGYTVTLVFADHGISILDGSAGPVDASIAGPYETLVDLLQGDDGPLRAHLGRRIRVRSRPSKLLFPLRVHNLMKLEPQPAGEDHGALAGVRDAALIGGTVIAATAALFYVF